MKILVAALALFFTFNVQAQHISPYELNSERELLLTGLGLGFYMSSTFMRRLPEEPTELSIQNLDRNKINFLDRLSLDQRSSTAAQVSDIFLYSSFVLPAIYFFDHHCENSRGTVWLMVLQTFLITDGLTNYAKGLAGRSRPFVYDPTVPLEEKLSSGSQLSFFSGHTSNTAALTFLCAKVFADHHPEHNLKPLIWSLAALIPAGVGTGRVLAGKHFPTDVLTGYLVGAAVGYLIPHWHKRKDIEHTHEHSLLWTPMISRQGLGLGLRYQF